MITREIAEAAKKDPFEWDPDIRPSTNGVVDEFVNPVYKSLIDRTSTEFRFDVGAPAIIDTTEYSRRSYYKGNRLVKRNGVQVNFTPEMKEELRRCKEDILYFAERYFYIRTLDYGKIKIPLYDYQKMWLRFSEYPELRERIMMTSRQAGKSTVVTIEVLHAILFHDDFQVAILANKGGTAREIFSRVRTAYEMLPFWMQIGVIEWNKGSVELENNSKVFAASSDSDSVRGFTLNLVLLDEMAFIKGDEEFMTSTYPVIASGKTSRIVMISTPNGKRGVFYRTMIQAQKGKNTYFSFGVPWYMVPGRDAEWKRRTISNTSAAQFQQEQNIKFRGTSATLVDSNILEDIIEHLADPEVEYDYAKRYALPVDGAAYVMVVDTAEGKGMDYSTFTIFRVDKQPYETVLTFRSNDVSPLVFPYHIVRWAREYNMALVVIENNGASGALVAVAVHQDHEYENTFCENVITEMGIGVRTSPKVKTLGCSMLKDLIERKTLLVRDKEQYHELLNFERKGKSYEGAEGVHDDMVQNLWMFGYFTTREEFHEYLVTGNLATDLYYDEVAGITAQISVDNGLDAPTVTQLSPDRFW